MGMNFQPRGSMVLIRLLLEKAQQVGALTIPTSQDEYCEGIVEAVGPGLIQAAGGRPDTHDLQVGQRVLVQHKRFQRDRRGVIQNSRDEGIPLAARHQDGKLNDSEQLMLFNEINILAIVGEKDTLEVIKTEIE